MADDEVQIKITFNPDTGELEGIEEYLERIRDAADQAGDSIDSMTMMQAGQALQQYGAAAEDMAQGMNEAQITVGQLAIQTGFTEPKMKELVNSISSADFPQDEAMMYIKSLDQMGVSAGNLGQSASDIDKIADAFQLSGQTANSMGQELGVLGVDMNNVSSSFNALAYANANTVGGMDNYYTFLRKYDAQFNELGYNVDQASLIIAAATQKYGGGRAALSGLSTALKDANGDSRALEQALGMQAGSLDNASAITGEYEGKLEAMADEEGEHKTILDHLGAAYDKLALSVGDTISPIAGLLGFTGQLAGFGMELNGVWELAQKLGEVEGFSKLKTGLMDVATRAKGAATAMLDLGKKTLMAGLNALRSAAMWVVQKVQLIASTLATWAMAAAQAALNFIMSLNPIVLVVIAIIALIAVLAYLYYNVDSVRQAIDNLGASIIATAQWIYNGFMNIVNIVSSALGSAWNSITSFCSNMVSGLINAAMNAVNGFANYIRQIPQMVMDEFNRTLGLVGDFISSLPSRVWDMGVAIIDALKHALGIGSPGHMYYMIEGELGRIDDLTGKADFTSNMNNIGQGMVSGFNPDLQTGNAAMIGSSGNNITINIENVDNEERIKQIVKAVEDALRFDNETAGRTV